MAAIDFEALLERSPNPYMVLDRDLRYVWANAAYLRITSSRLDDLLGRHILDAFPNDPDDPHNDNARLLRESFERVLATGERDVLAYLPYRIERDTAAGRVLEERLWSATHTPITDERGEVSLILQHTVDVTELYRLRGINRHADPDGTAQKAAGVLERAQRVQEASLILDQERRHLRSLFAQAPGFMAFMSGREHVFVLANQAYLQLVGRSDIIGKPLREVLPEVQSQGFVELLDAVYSSGKPYVGRGVRALLQRTPGDELDEVFLDFVYQPIFDAHGAVDGIFVQGHEITAEKRLETQRQQLLERERAARAEAEAAREDAEEANRLKDEFLATLSHELRTPLNAMIGWVRILRTQPLDEGSRGKALDTIERNAAVQARLVQDLLDVSSIITGKLRLTVAPLDLRDVVRAAVETVTPAADAKGVEIRRGDGHPVPITGDAGRLQQVVWNLLTNAVKFTPPGGRVDIVLTETAEAVRLAITDSGTGIAPDLLPFIFERFRQGDSSIDRGHGGLGLGLAIVKHVVEAHGGSVRASSEGRGRGATFFVDLPRRGVPPTA
jgi:PAS domain S-box-containing protein